MNPFYRICVFGDTSEFQNVWQTKLENAINVQLGEFGMSLGNEVLLEINPTEVKKFRISTVGLFWGGMSIPEYKRPKNFADHYPIIPIVSDEANILNELPEKIAVYSAIGINCMSPEVIITAAIMECLGILPDRRRIFISYRREDAPEVALQLFYSLRERKFNVFLDTHEITAGLKFQDYLLHELSDSDIMIMLDTETFFESKWTEMELKSANSMNIGILRLKFPNAKNDGDEFLTIPVEISESDIKDDNSLEDDVVESIVMNVEENRSKCVARRISRLKRQVLSAAKVGQNDIPISGNNHEMRIKLADNTHAWIYPTTVVPNSKLIHDISKSRKSKEFSIMYDDRFVEKNWINHLDWLEEKVDKFSWLKLSNVNQKLRGE